MEGLKAQVEELTNGGKKKKEKKGLFGGSKKKWEEVCKSEVIKVWITSFKNH